METISKKIGELIKEKRLSAGLSQAALENISGLKEEVLWQIEVGKTIPIERTIWRVSAALCLHRREIHEALDSARQQRKNRDSFKKEYAIKCAHRLINRHYHKLKDQEKN